MPAGRHNGICRRRGKIGMVSTKKFLKLLGATEKEVEEIINKMSEKDAKELLIKLVKFMNEQKKTT